ncbi:MAG: four helix bundle protein [Planctomycetaceae bacterium]|nr:four helix bundle protein [Planctomycetaceae bacterium]
MAVQHYRQLIAWQKAMDLVEAVYRTTNSFPKTEVYGLASQLQRAAVSVPSNIAEGQGRSTTRDFLHFLSIAQGSLMEVETQATIAKRLGYIEEPVESSLLEAAAEVGRLLNGLCNSLNKKLNN